MTEATHAHDNSPEAVKKEIRKYLYVFGALAVLTAITVAVSYAPLNTWQAILVALLVATVKGSLVAAFFMHLVSERKLIYAVLVLTVFFFAVLMWGPWHHKTDAEREWPGMDTTAAAPSGETKASPAAEDHSEH